MAKRPQDRITLKLNEQGVGSLNINGHDLACTFTTEVTGRTDSRERVTIHAYAEVDAKALETLSAPLLASTVWQEPLPKADAKTEDTGKDKAKPNAA